MFGIESPTKDQVIALAGMAQSAALIHYYANGIQVKQTEFVTLLTTITDLNPTSVINLYGDYRNLTIGFELVHSYATKKMPVEHRSIWRYVDLFIGTQKALSKNNHAMQALQKSLATLANQVQFTDVASTQIQRNFADVYDTHILPLKKQVFVTGDKSVLSQDSIQLRVKSLSLSGLRSTVLWRQLGGRQGTLAFKQNELTQFTTPVIDAMS